jgi:hypothetical protein
MSLHSGGYSVSPQLGLFSVKNRNRLRRNLDCRHPRRRMIQHAAAIVIGPAGSGILDRPPDDDSKQGRAATPQSIVIPGASETNEPGIHNHDREYGFRARPAGVPE